MPLNYSRKLTGRLRQDAANRQISFVLACIAGAVNAGGFLAIQRYTSHVTGIVSSVADQLALGWFGLAWEGALALFAFVLGAATCAAMVQYARKRRLHSLFALPLLLEAALLLCFGLLGARLTELHSNSIPLTVALLCFIMGLQNALITKLSAAEIRTTHVTGIVTDIGIELGKLAGAQSRALAHASRQRLTLLATLLSCFFLGAVGGALAFKHVGYIMSVPAALVLAALACAPIIDDLRFMRNSAPRR